MASEPNARLDVGDQFPAMTFDLVDGGRLELPTDLSGAWSVLLLYRGHW